MVKRTFLIICLGMMGLLAGCGTTASGPLRDINDPTNSLVLGYIDMEDAPTKAKTATFLQVAPPSDAPYWVTSVDEGLFYHVFLPPGSYQLTKVYGSGFFAGENEYSFPRQGNETSLRISKPGIYFIGSFKYKQVKTGFFEGRKFMIERVSKPTEAELLKRVLEYDKVAKSAWGAKIRARLAQLRQ